MFFVDSTNCATHEWSFDSIWEMLTGFGECLRCLCHCRMKWDGKINICHTTDEQMSTHKLEQLKIAHSCNIARGSEHLQCVNWRKWKWKKIKKRIVVVCNTFPSPFADQIKLSLSVNGLACFSHSAYTSPSIPILLYRLSYADKCTPAAIVLLPTIYTIYIVDTSYTNDYIFPTIFLLNGNRPSNRIRDGREPIDQHHNKKFLF